MPAGLSVPPAGRLILPAGSVAHRLLSDIVQNCKAIVFAGLPGVGKTLLLQQVALLARTTGRPLHLLQWDVARQAFETPAILARHPEVAGTTHAAIRRATGFWVRDAVAAWARAHAGDEALLLGEAPLVGYRFIGLARRGVDAAEAFLASPATRFIIPVPSPDVREKIEAARAREMERPRHAREAANAPPNVLAALMEELRAAGAALEVAGAAPAGGAFAGSGYDAAVYAAVYTRLLEHRHAEVLALDEYWPVAHSPYDLEPKALELQPAPAEVRAAMERVEALDETHLEREVRNWFLPG